MAEPAEGDSEPGGEYSGNVVRTAGAEAQGQLCALQPEGRIRPAERVVRPAAESGTGGQAVGTEERLHDLRGAGYEPERRQRRGREHRPLPHGGGKKPERREVHRRRPEKARLQCGGNCTGKGLPDPVRRHPGMEETGPAGGQHHRRHCGQRGRRRGDDRRDGGTEREEHRGDAAELGQGAAGDQGRCAGGEAVPAADRRRHGLQPRLPGKPEQRPYADGLRLGRDPEHARPAGRAGSKRQRGPGNECGLPAVQARAGPDRSGAERPFGREPGGAGCCEQRSGEPGRGCHQPGGGAAGAELTGRGRRHGPEHREGRERGQDAGGRRTKVRRGMGHQLGGRGRPGKDHGQ